MDVFICPNCHFITIIRTTEAEVDIRLQMHELKKKKIKRK